MKVRISLSILIFALLATSLWLGKEQRALGRKLQALREAMTSSPPSEVSLQSMLPARQVLRKRVSTINTEPIEALTPGGSWKDLGDQLGQGLARLHQLFEKHPELERAEGESRLDTLPTLTTDTSLPADLRAELISEADFIMRSMIATVTKLGPGGMLEEETDTPDANEAHPFGISLIAGVLGYEAHQRDALHQVLTSSANPVEALMDQLTPAELRKLIEAVRGKPQSELSEDERREVLEIVNGPKEFLK